jgi:adenosine deaminase
MDQAVKVDLEGRSVTLDKMIERLKALPKVLLHDHLDGGLRPGTVLALAHEVGHDVPVDDEDGLAAWFADKANQGSLEAYLETFEHTVAVMQTADALRRVAREAVEDLVDDGVVLSELRWAPEQHLRRGLTLDEAVDAVQAGIDEATAAAGTIRVGQILCAMRHLDSSDEIAQLALRHRDRGVVGFDLAGPEEGFGPERAASALDALREADMPVTLHAGESGSAGSMRESMRQAVHRGALRLGHGVAVADELDPEPTAFAHWVRDRRIVLEICPSSNVQTGAATSIADHPATRLLRDGFAVTVSTDNRLQSGTSLSRELALLVTQAGWTMDDVAQVTLTAARASFLHHDERESLVASVIGPGHAGASGGRHRA